MADLDALLLARIQFAFTVSFHIVFPAITIGLASYLAVLEAGFLGAMLFGWSRVGPALHFIATLSWPKWSRSSQARGVLPI